MLPRISFGMVMLIVLSVHSGRAENAGGKFSDSVTQPVEKSVKIRKETQNKEEKWRDERQKIADRYEQLLADRELLKSRHGELQEITNAARQRIAEKEKQLADIGQVQTDIEPFLGNMLGMLRKLMAEGMPFLAEERATRIERLDQILKDPDVTISEKYRKAMEAMMVEAEYGNTVEVGQQTINAGGHDMLTNIFRLGRIGLF